MVSTESSGDPGEVAWTAGFDVDFQRDNRENYVNSGGTRGTLTLDQFETVTAGGLFLQARATLTDRVSAMAGVRYDRFQFEVQDRLTTDGSGDESGDRTMDSFSPTLGIVVEASSTLHLFANVATYLATPTTTELANQPDGSGGFNPNLDPQTGITEELGMRGQWNGRWGYEASVFRSDLKDELVPFENALQPGRVFQENAGSSTYQGFEASLSAVLPEGIFGQISYSFIDAKFDEFQDEDGNVFDGNVVPGLSKHRIDGLLRVTQGQWYGEVRGDYVGRAQTNKANDPMTHAKAYTLWDFRTGLASQRVGNFEVAPFVSVTNIFNNVYSAAIAVNAFRGRYFEPGPRRAFSAGLSATFQ